MHRALGMVADELGFAPCPLPGHDGSAYLICPAEGEDSRFSCDCLGVGSRFPGDQSVSSYDRHLADAYHAICSGRVIGRGDTLPRNLRAYWRLRLSQAVGLLEPVEVPRLPLDAGEDAVRARDLFALVCARNLITVGSVETQFARSFVAATLEITVDAARLAIGELRSVGVIVLDHAEGVPGRDYVVNVYVPGEERNGTY